MLNKPSIFVCIVLAILSNAVFAQTKLQAKQVLTIYDLTDNTDSQLEFAKSFSSPDADAIVTDKKLKLTIPTGGKPEVKFRSSINQKDGSIVCALNLKVTVNASGGVTPVLEEGKCLAGYKIFLKSGEAYTHSIVVEGPKKAR